MKIEMNYRKFLEENAYFHYLKGVGFHVRINWDQLETFVTKYRSKIKALVVDADCENIFDD